MFVKVLSQQRASRIAVMLLALLLPTLMLQPATAQAVHLPDFTELVERVGPAVVNIRTTERGRAATANNSDVDPAMEEFLRRFGIPMPTIRLLLEALERRR